MSYPHHSGKGHTASFFSLMISRICQLNKELEDSIFLFGARQTGINAIRFTTYKEVKNTLREEYNVSCDV